MPVSHYSCLLLDVHALIFKQELLLHTETLLRAALVRFEVLPGTLNRLLHVTSTMYRRSKTLDVNGAEFPTNHIAMGVMDIISDFLKGKVRVLPLTVTAMLEVFRQLFRKTLKLIASFPKGCDLFAQ